MTFRPDQFFEVAIAAARTALRDYEPDQIPASLRRVVAYSGGSLPPPFARSLLVELLTNDHLREKAAEVLDRDRSGPRSQAALLLLDQPGGWLLDLLERAFTEGSAAGSQQDVSVELERDALQAEVISLRERVKAMRSEMERIEREARASVDEARRPGRSDRVGEERLRSELQAAEDALEASSVAAEARERALVAEVQAARDEARSARRERAEVAKLVPTSSPGIPAMSPPEMARHLDMLSAALSADTGVGVPENGTSSNDRLSFPSDVRPDSADAIEWVRRTGDLDVLLDGYNIGFLLAGALDPTRARLLADEVARRLAAGADLRVTVVFDSEISVEETTPATGPIRVVFSGGRTGDDVIVDRAGEGERTVVISNDRDVRVRSEDEGAVSLWSDALAEWSRRR